MLDHLKFALRQLRKSPGFAAAVIVLIALMASLLPTLRISRIDPALTLRSE